MWGFGLSSYAYDIFCYVDIADFNTDKIIYKLSKLLCEYVYNQFMENGLYLV